PPPSLETYPLSLHDALPIFDLHEVVKTLNTSPSSQHHLKRDVAQLVELLLETTDLRQRLLKTIIDLPERIPQLFGAIIQTTDNIEQITKEVPKPSSRIGIDDPSRLQTRDDRLDHAGDCTRSKARMLRPHSIRDTDQSRTRHAAPLKARGPEEFEHRCRPSPQHIPRDDGFPAMDDAGDLIEW